MKPSCSFITNPILTICQSQHVENQEPLVKNQHMFPIKKHIFLCPNIYLQVVQDINKTAPCGHGASTANSRSKEGECL